ncbi:MAG TPA: hypothetical protein VNT52_09370 [Acidimicrobiales bacterium]|nr:hypothetical protein [Acidimicrobiales bacterium]
MGDRLPIRGGQDRTGGDTDWRELAARYAKPGDARRLTAQVLRASPDLRLADVVGVIGAACAAGMPSPAPGRCQTIDAGLAAIDVRGPGWVDRRYPVAVVVPELAEAGFDAAHIVALFNGNVPMEQLGPAVAALFPDYVPHTGDEALGALLEDCWRCPLRCCQPPARRRLSRWGRGVLPGAPAPTSVLAKLEPPGVSPPNTDDLLDRLAWQHQR